METTLFTSFLDRKFLEWQTKTGKRQTIKEFAKYLGVSRPLLSMWMTGRQQPGQENINNLAEKLGSEVYDALNLPRPDPLLTELNNLWETFDDNQKDQIRTILKIGKSAARANPKTQPR